MRLMLLTVVVGTAAFAANPFQPVATGYIVSEPGPGDFLVGFWDSEMFDPALDPPPLPGTQILDEYPGDGTGYYLVQFAGPIHVGQIDQLTQTGAGFIGFHSRYLAFAKMNAALADTVRGLPFIRWVGMYHPGYKFDSRTLEEEGYGRVSVTIFYPEDIEQAELDLAGLGCEIVRTGESELMKGVEVDCERELLINIAWLPYVMSIEEWHPAEFENSDCQWVIQTWTEDNRRVWDHGVDGTGEILGLFDGRVDHRHYAFHDDEVAISDTGEFQEHRKIVVLKRYPPGKLGLAEDHGTHVGGTIAGNDSANGGISLHKGHSRGARLAHLFPEPDAEVSIFTSHLNVITNELRYPELRPSTISCSWGTDKGKYTNAAASFDAFAWKNKDVVLIKSAGNRGQGGSKRITEPGNSKSIITVAAVLNGTQSDQLYEESSRGPAPDGRVKPDISVPGVEIWSASGELNGYTERSGTSMAAAAVNGAVGLLRSYLRKGYYPSGQANPADTFGYVSAALLKAMLLVSADTIGGYTVPSDSIGWGRANLDSVLYFTGDARKLLLHDDTVGLATGSFVEYRFQVDGSMPLRVGVVWTDTAAAAGANPALINDLDAILTGPDRTFYLGNRYEGGLSVENPPGDTDRLNPVEMFRVHDPEPGTWMLTVRGRHVPVGGTQPYAVVITGPLTGPLGFGWTGVASMPEPFTVRRGAFLATGEAQTETRSSIPVVYAAKGNKTREFYYYNPSSGDYGTWVGLPQIPYQGRPVERGCRGVWSPDDNRLYVVYGNNTDAFLAYDPETKAWSALQPVPPGPSGRRVKGGGDLDYHDGYVYLLKGDRNDFMRYDIDGGTWEVLSDAPADRYKRDSWLVSDGEGKLYLHQARNHGFWVYDIELQNWAAAPGGGMPLSGDHGGRIRNKKAKDGSSAALGADGNIYALKGGNTTMFYRYDTDAGDWTELPGMPREGSSPKARRVGPGADIVHYGTGVFYALKGNKTLEFWRYLAADGPGFGSVSGGGGGMIPLGGGEEPVLEGYAACRPRWSPDGGYVCYFREDDCGVEQIFVSDAAGQSEWQLTFGEGDCQNPVFSPDGGYVAYQQEDTASGYWQIAVIAFDPNDPGGEQVGGLAPALPVSVPAAVAPARREVLGADLPVPPEWSVSPGPADVRPGQGTPPSAPTCAVPTVLTPGLFEHENPDWSPDGFWLVYQKEDTTGYIQLYRVPSGGGPEQQLTWESADHEDPRYLTDSIIVYTRSAYGEYDQIYRLYVPTRENSALTSSDYDHGRPAPEPGGMNVVFEVEDEYGMTQLGRVSATGGGEQALTGEEIDLETPVWSADGQSVFCVGWRYPGTEIGLTSAATGGYQVVTDATVIRLHPDVYYQAQAGTNLVIYEREELEATGLDGDREYRPRKAGCGIFIVRLMRGRPGGGAQSGEPCRLALERVRPNPATGQLRLRWQVPGRGRVTVRAFDVTGRVVRVLCDEELASGTYDCRWDRTDEAGRKLPAGVYFVTLESGGHEVRQKVVLQR